MRKLTLTESNLVSAACGEENCQKATLDMLELCSASQRYLINMTLKTIALSDEMKNADPEKVRSAMITAIQNMDFNA
jgi:hypothetical protein